MNEIDEFLKRAAAMRARQKAAEAKAQRPAAPAPSPTSPPARTKPARPLTSRSSFDVVQDAEVIEDAVSGDDVAQYVKQHLDASGLHERTPHLAQSVRASDEAIEERLHQTFEHRLGQLGATTAKAEDSTLDAEEAAAAAAARRLDTQASAIDLRSLLRSRQSLRNAIILAEVLNPPTHRW